MSAPLLAPAATSDPLPEAPLAAGLAVLLLGARPRLTVPGSAAASVAAYLAETIGTTLDRPDPIMNATPFHHVATVPAEPFDPVAAAVMATLAPCPSRRATSSSNTATSPATDRRGVLRLRPQGPMSLP